VKAWVVELADCQEAVIRMGETIEDVNEPDDLGCPVLLFPAFGSVSFAWRRVSPSPVVLGEAACRSS
jgi:hypothetical protein